MSQFPHLSATNNSNVYFNGFLQGVDHIIWVKCLTQSQVHINTISHSPGREVCSNDLRFKQVFGAREQNAKDKDINKTSLGNAPKESKTSQIH